LIDYKGVDPMGTVSRGRFAAHLRCPRPPRRVKVRYVDLGTPGAIIVRHYGLPPLVLADHQMEPVELEAIVTVAEHLGGVS
jgi:hypothetical protein